jgi:hypothetical protein
MSRKGLKECFPNLGFQAKGGFFPVMFIPHRKGLRR